MGYIECSIWDPSWERVKHKCIQTAKEAYNVRWQSKRLKRQMK